MPSVKSLEALSVPELLRRRHAMRHRRDELTEQGIDTQYGDELQVRQSAVWWASRATISTENMSLEELPVAPGDGNEARLRQVDLKALADKTVLEMLGDRAFELHNVDLDTRAHFTAVTLVQIEAELLRRLVPEFAHTVREKKRFLETRSPMKVRAAAFGN